MSCGWKTDDVKEWLSRFFVYMGNIVTSLPRPKISSTASYDTCISQPRQEEKDCDQIVSRALGLPSPCPIPGAAPKDSAGNRSPRSHPQTRSKLITQMKTWFDGETPQELLLWINGDADVGKSGVLRAFAEYLGKEKKLGASVFICRETRCNNPHYIFRTIAFQLSIQMEAYRNFVVERLKLDPELPYKDIKAQFAALIIEPFGQMKIGVGGKRWGILLDGLDKLEGEDAQCEIIRLITAFANEYCGSPLAWIISSRREPHISNTFARSGDQNYKPLCLPTNSTEACEEVELFFRSSFEAMRKKHRNSAPKYWPSYTEFLMLTTAASGLLVYAEAVMKFIDPYVQPYLAQVNPSQTDSTQSDTAQPNCTQASLAQSDTAQFNASQAELEHADPAQAIPTQACPNQSGLAQATPAQAVPAQAGPVQAGPAQANLTQAGLTHARFPPAECLTHLISIISSYNTPSRVVDSVIHLDALYKETLSLIPLKDLQLAKRLLAYIIHVKEVQIGEAVLPQSLQTIRGMTILFDLPRTIHPCLLICHSTVKASDWKVAHKKSLTFLHISFADYLQDAARSGDFHIGDARDITNHVALLVLKLWNCYHGGTGGPTWHTYCSDLDEDTPSRATTKFHAKLFRDIVTLIRSLVHHTLSKQVEDLMVNTELRKVDMIKLCRCFDARDLWDLVNILVDQGSCVNDTELLRRMPLKGLEFENLDCEVLSPASAHYKKRGKSNLEWILRRPRSKSELEIYVSELRNLQAGAQELPVIIFGGVPKGRIAAFQHTFPDGLHRYIIPCPE